MPPLPSWVGTESPSKPRALIGADRPSTPTPPRSSKQSPTAYSLDLPDNNSSLTTAASMTKTANCGTGWSTIDCPDDKQRPFAVSAAAMGLSLQQILALLPILLPVRRRPSRAALGRWVNHASRRAGRLLQVLDRAAQALVLCLCIDEIFFHRKPVLMGIEPFSMAWVLGQRAADRTGATWAKALAAWPKLRDVAADGGSGLELGLELEVNRRREEAQQTQTPPVPLHAELDVFHTSREGGRASAADWRHAEAVWQAAEKVARAKERFDKSGNDGRGFKKTVVEEAWAAVAAFEETDGKEKAWQRAQAALRVLRPDGQRNDRVWATAELQAATEALTGQRWAKTRRLLLDDRTLTFPDRLHAELAVAEPDPERREALVALWCWRQEEKRGGQEQRQCGRGVVSEALAELIRQRLGQDGKESYGRVAAVLRRVLRE